MKKHIFRLCTLLLAALWGSGCTEEIKFGDNFLDKAPGVDIDIDEVFSKAENARYFLWNVYADMYVAFNERMSGTTYRLDGGHLDALSDSHHSAIGYDSPGTTYYPGVYSVKNENDNSNRCKFPFTKARVWECVRNAWIFIENIDRVPDMSQEEKERLIAEAKIVMASRYFDMFRHFGGLPLVDHAQDMSVVNKDCPRRTVEETVQFIVDLLDQAAATPSLPWALTGSDQVTWEGRMTRSAALGLKCKVLMFAASPLFNDDVPYCLEPPQEAVEKRQVWYGNFDVKRWEACRDACKAFFDENRRQGEPIHLVQATGDLTMDVMDVNNPYRLAFRNGYLFRGSPEFLITVHNEKYLTNYRKYDESFIWSDRSMKGNVAPTQELVDNFVSADGTPFDTEGMYEPGNPQDIKPYHGRDPRFYETILANGTPWRGGKAELWEGGYMKTNRSSEYIDTRSTAHGYDCFKFITDRVISSNIPFQYPYLRLSEIYLIYAEALAETGDLPGAIEQVNIVRSRVGLGDLDACNPSLSLTSNKENLIKEILRERVCELTLEDVRFFDMVRRKLEADFTKRLHGVKIYRLDDDGNIVKTPWKGTNDEKTKPFPTRFSYERITITERYWQKPGMFSPKWYLSAVPTNEINKGYGMTQNPGW